MSGNLAFTINGATATNRVRKPGVEILYTLANKTVFRGGTFDGVVPSNAAYRLNTDWTFICDQVSPSVRLFDGRIMNVDNAAAIDAFRGVVNNLDAVSYELALDQRYINHTEYGSDSVQIAIVAVGNPAPVTTRVAHGFATGDYVIIEGITGSNNNAAVNATHQITVTGGSNFTIPVNITVAGGGNATVRKVTKLTTILDYINTTYLAGYGISIDYTAIVGTPLLEKQVFDKISVTEVLRHLAVVTNTAYRFLQSSRLLEVFTVGQKLASFNLTAANTLAGITWRKTRASQANTINVNYGTASVVSKDMPFVGNGVTRVFPLSYTPILASATSSPGQIWNYAESRWQHVGRYGVDTLYEFVYRESDNSIYQLADWGGITGWPVIATGVGYFFQADIQFPQVVTVVDAADVALNGTRELPIDFPDTFDIETARQFGQAQLRIALVVARRVSIPTRQGLEMPGTVFTVNIPAHDLATSTWLVSSVTFHQEEGGQHTYVYELIEGSTVVPNWRDELRELFGGGGSSTTGGTVSGGGIPASTGDLIFADVYANPAAVGAGLIYESSIRGNFTNASHVGPALVLGPTSGAQSWAISADYSASASRKSLRFIAIAETSSRRWAMQLSQASTPAIGEYYLTPNGTAGGVLNIGAPTAIYGSGFRVNAYVQDLEQRGGVSDFQTGVATSKTLIAQGVATNVSHFYDTTPVTGPHFALVSQIVGSASGTPGYKVAGYYAAETRAGADDIFALNAVAQWRAGDTISNVIPFEIDISNLNADRGINSTPWVNGMLLVSGGTHKPHAAIHVYCSDSANKFVKIFEASNRPYETGFECMSDTGIEIAGPSSSALIGSGVFRQISNGGDTLLLQRRTDTSPTGFFIRVMDVAETVLFALGITGSITMPVANTSIEIGSSTTPNTPFFDFQSSGNANDYDSRILASGGGGSAGLGTLTVTAATFAVSASLTANKVLASAGIRSASGTTASTASGTPVTLFAVSSGSGATVARYLVRAGLGTNSNDAANYGAYADVAVEGTSARIVSSNTPAMTITLSGLNVQATQSSGVSSTIQWNVLKIGD